MIIIRLWHIDLLPVLPRQQILGQWRECLALLGKGFGKKHKTVDYVFNYSDKKLMRFADKVFLEMIKRGYKPNPEKIINALIRRYECTYDEAVSMYCDSYGESGYEEHDSSYLAECLENLRGKGIEIIL